MKATVGAYRAAGAALPSGAATRYIHLSGGGIVLDATEGQKQTKLRQAGTLSGLQVRVSANAKASGSTVIRSRKNGANGNLSVTIPAGATGVFEDTANNDSVAAGDLVCWQSDSTSGSGTVTVVGIGALYEGSGGTTHAIAGGATGGISANSSTRFLRLAGELTASTSESAAALDVQTGLTVRTLQISVTANSRITDCTLRTRKNGANGNGVITIPAGATGLFEDASNTDTFAAGDTCALALSTSTGGGTINGVAAVEITYPGDAFQAIGLDAADYNFGETRSAVLPSGPAALVATEADAQHKAALAVRVSLLKARASGNDIDAGAALTLRKGSADTALTVTIPANTSGTFEDASNSASFATTDTWNWRAVVAGSTGDLALEEVTAVVTLLVAAELAATPSCSATASAALTTTIRLAATASADTTAVAALTTSIDLAAAASAQASAAAALTTDIQLVAAASGTVAGAADLDTAILLAAAASVPASGQAALTTAILLAAAASAAATGAATLIVPLVTTPTYAFVTGAVPRAFVAGLSRHFTAGERQ